MEIGVVVGNPKRASRTLGAASYLATALAGAPPSVVLDLVELGPALLEWGAPAVTEAVSAVQALDVVVFASPTYKATYTGLLKLLLDQIPTGGLAGVVGVPLMLGAGPGHALAPELLLKPVLVELGAVCPAGGLYVVDAQHEDPSAFEPWLAAWRAVIERAAGTGSR